MSTRVATETDGGDSLFVARKRTRRACDRCSNLRTRCDGQQPCRRCEEYQQHCRYSRIVGKRGRKPGGHRSDVDPHSDMQPESYVQEEQELDQPPDQQLNQHQDQQVDQQPSTITHDISIYHAENAPASSPALVSDIAYPSVSVSTVSEHLTPPSLASLAGLHAQVSPGHVLADFPTPGLDHGPIYSISGYEQHEMHHESHESHNQTDPRLPQHVPSPNTSSHTFKCLEPVLPSLKGVVSEELACELLKLYFVEPGGSLFRSASPYILTHVLRKDSVLRQEHNRRTTPALLVTMLWAAAQEADGSLFFIPGQKARVCEGLRRIMLSLIRERDCDSWHRNTAGQLVKEPLSLQTPTQAISDSLHHYQRQAPSVDDVLTFILITIVVSGGQFKSDCFRWWQKALRLSRLLGLNREYECDQDGNAMACCTKDASCSCHVCDARRLSISVPELQEERRRVFWLLFCLDRHLSLSFNYPLSILDDECQLYCPLPDDVWQSSVNQSFDLDLPSARSTAGRTYGPPTTVTGIHFFGYFLPLMTILGDVIQVHHYKCHPRFGRNTDKNYLVKDHPSSMVALLEDVMAGCARSIDGLSSLYPLETDKNSTSPESRTAAPDSQLPAGEPMEVLNPIYSAGYHVERQTVPRGNQHAQAELVSAYSSFILHVLYVLLYGKWDAVSMLENRDGWISSVEFVKCASHSISASDEVSRILACDPELGFIPYLFGIYLLHGSFVLLLFADRMPQVGLNESVERACEIIIRVHEICVVTLQTEFQKQFRKVLRSTLYSVRSAGGSTAEESMARRRVLSLYRWSNGFTGLAV